MITEFDLLECGNTAWAFARFALRTPELFGLLFGRVIAHPEEVDAQAVHALCCATWTLGEGELPWRLMEGRERHGLALDATSHGFLLMHAAWQGNVHREAQVLLALASSAAAEALLLLTLYGGIMVCLAVSPSLCPTPSDEQAWYRYQKLGRLVQHVEATALGGNPQSMLSCIEGFVQDGHRRWLKIAGGPKALAIDAATRARPCLAHEVAAEMGCFVGYTAIRLGWRLQATPGVLSTELEAVHVCIARHHINAAKLGSAAEVWPGHIPWATPHYVEQFGDWGVGFTFMDHKGTRFHDDLHDCTALRILAPRSRLLCDNVLKPGAPAHLWMHHRAPTFAAGAVVWAMHEFLEPEMEDWQSLRDQPPPR